MKRIKDKYKPELKFCIGDEKRSELEFAIYLCGQGAIFHVIAHTPEQLGTLYIILVDGKYVVRFEISYGASPYRCTDVAFYKISEFRKMIGQGKIRMKLDRAVDEINAILLSDPLNRLGAYPMLQPR